MVTMKEKKTQGRQRIEIKKLENGSNKQVTFSKRRSGLFKKAGELCILCGADVAALVFSPNGKLFCFAHPSFDSIVLRYVRGTSIDAAAANCTTTSTNNNSSTNVDSPPLGSVVPVDEFTRDYVEAAKAFEAEKSRLLEAAKKVKSDGGGEKFWWDQGIQGMGIKELEQHMAALHELKRRVAARFQELKMGSNNDASSAVVVLPLSFHRSGLGFEIENNRF